MPTLGNRTLSVDTIDRNEVLYAGALNSVSHEDLVTMRRTRNAGAPLRTNLKFTRGFPSSVAGESEKVVTISLAATVHPNVVVADVVSFVNDTLAQAATMFGSFSTTGDINL